MKNLLFLQIFFFFIGINLFANDLKVDNLLEKIQQSKTQKEKENLLNQLKYQLFQINKKAREESNAILDAKTKVPTKTFQEEK